MELLSPAGGWEAFLAAIENGADAVYIGGKDFSARQSAENFDDAQIKAAVDYAHCRAKKVYVTANTLIDNADFGPVLDYIFKLNQYGVDAFIIQDLGLIEALNRIMPALRIHASTQMTIHNAAGVEFCAQHGIKRVVLAREISLENLRSIHRAVPEVELEYFVHGALCYCYSGQCLFSSMVGGRSGNRGRCAQPCRLAYELFSARNHTKINLGDKGKYLLSPADLCLLEYLPLLKQAGVYSLKIEGRMKRPEYVATVTRTYREVLDRIERDEDYKPPQDYKNNLLKIFNRNFSTGYLFPRPAEFLSTTRPNNRGVCVGRVVEQDRNYVTRIKLTDKVGRGDGLDIWVSKGRGPVFTVRELQVNGQPARTAERGDIITVQLDAPAQAGDRVFKTHDACLLDRAMESIRPCFRSKILVNAVVYLSAGQPMKIVLTDENGNIGEAVTASAAVTADKRPLTGEVLRDKLGRMGNTPFELGELLLNCNEKVLVPFSEINVARRQATEILMQKRLKISRPPVIERHAYITAKEAYIREFSPQVKRKTILAVMVSNPAQARRAIQGGADRVYLDIAGLGQRRRVTREKMQELRDYAADRERELIPALPRIILPDEPGNYELINGIFTRVMAGNPGSVRWCRQKGLQVWGDYTLNIFNRYALNFMLQEGLAGVCLSPELNLKQLQQFDNFDRVELLIHGELILMVSQYCLLSGLLGPEKKCPLYCQKDQYYLKDELGYEFPVATDTDCRCYVFNSRTLCMMDHLDQIVAMGPGSIRIEARRLEAPEVEATTAVYRRALDEINNGLTPDLNLYKDELALPGHQFTRCHYYRGVL